MIHLVLGKQGSGKTLYLVRQALLEFQKGKRVVSNVHLSFPFEILDYQKVVDCKYQDAVVILDEIHQLLPARRSMRKINVEICDGFISMARKQDIEIWGSTQLPRKVDVRFREEADYVYHCEKFAWRGGQWIRVLHNEDLPAEVPLMISVDVLETFTNNQLKTCFFANDLFSKYDTREVIKVRGLKNA